jgi:hypothetical protein
MCDFTKWQLLDKSNVPVLQFLLDSNRFSDDLRPIQGSAVAMLVCCTLAFVLGM